MNIFYLYYLYISKNVFSLLGVAINGWCPSYKAVEAHSINNDLQQNKMAWVILSMKDRVYACFIDKRDVYNLRHILWGPPVNRVDFGTSIMV